MALDHSFHVAVDLDVWLASRAQLIVFKRLLVGLGDQLVDQLAHQVLAVQLADMGCGHFARTEALELHLRPDFFNPLVEFGLQFRGRHFNGERAAKTFCLGLGNFHRFNHPYLGSRAQEMRAGAL